MMRILIGTYRIFYKSDSGVKAGGIFPLAFQDVVQSFPAFLGGQEYWFRHAMVKLPEPPIGLVARMNQKMMSLVVLP